jgi:hypothetical protein
MGYQPTEAADPRRRHPGLTPPLPLAGPATTTLRTHQSAVHVHRAEHRLLSYRLTEERGQASDNQLRRPS